MTTLNIPSAANLGMNYYHESMDYLSRTNTQINTDLTNIGRVTKNIKVYFNPLPQNSGGVSRSTALTNVQNIVTRAKAAGFHVVWVENIDQGQVLTDSTTDLSTPASYKWKWADYSTQVIADAALAQTAGADEFLVGNEIMGSTHYYAVDPGTSNPTTIYTGAAFPGNVSTLVAACRSNFSGTIGYQEVDTILPSWQTAGLGNLDKIYFDLYEQYWDFQVQSQAIWNAFGTKAVIGEMSSIDTMGNIGQYAAYADADWSRELLRRYDQLRQVGIQGYVFTYADTGSSNNGFAIRLYNQNNQWHNVWNYLTATKQLTYPTYFYDTFVSSATNHFSGGNTGTSGELDVDNTHATATASLTSFGGGTDYVFRGRVRPYSGTGSMRVCARYTDSNNYYAIDLNVSTNKVKLLRRQGGTETVLSSNISWPPSNSFEPVLSNFNLYDFELRVQGSGASTRVAAYLNTYKLYDATDAGNTGLNASTVAFLSLGGNSGGILNVTATALEAVQAITSGGTLSPYGVTMGSTTGSGTFPSQAITDMQALGVSWLRYQVPWSAIDTSGTTSQNSGTYHWGTWDSAVSQCNAAGINIILSIFKAPSQFQTGGNPDAPTYTATFAKQIAQRYNGGANGTIAGIEIGNEDYNGGADTTSPPFPSVQLLAATLQAVYPVVKAVNSTLLVGCGAKLNRNSAGYTAWFDTLLNPSTGAYSGTTFQADYLNFHYYTGTPQQSSGGPPVNLDPTVDIPSWNNGQGIPSITTAWQLIAAKKVQYNVTVPIWCTETGWTINTNPGRLASFVVSQTLQWQYLQAVLDSCRTSNGQVQKVFPFTLAYYDGYPAPNYRDGMSLVQGTLASPVYTTAYNGLQTYTSTYPLWSVGTAATTSAPTALQQPFEGQSWILPDNSLILVLNAGTINFSGAGTNHTIVLQSTNWQSTTPTWVFVKQITSTANMQASSYWDGTSLHVAYAGITAGAALGLFYISATYSGGIWAWDSAPTTLLAAADPTNKASVPCILANQSGTVFVAYRNQAISGAINSVCMFTRTSGVWSSSPTQMSVTSGTQGTYYGALVYGNSTVLLVTVENVTYYAQALPDGGSWGAAAIGPTSQIGTGQQFGPVSVVADSSHGAWVGISATTGLKVKHLTWSGNVVAWDTAITTIDSANNVSAPQWLYNGSTLYGFYFKLVSTGNADVYTVQYDPSRGSWSNATNLTKNTANNNVNPCVPANYVYSGSTPVMPYTWETGTVSPFTINIATQAPIVKNVTLLPGQFNTNGVSNFIFGTNLAQDVNPNGVLHNAAIQQRIKAGNFQVMRCGIPVGKSNAFIDQVVAAVVACGCQMLLNLDLTNLSWNESVISYLISNHPEITCMMYEVGNEPNGQGAGNLTGSQYFSTSWQPQVPALRGVAPPGSFFIGPVITHGGVNTTFTSDWLNACAAVGGTMLPDAISFHNYPCSTAANSTVCNTLSTSFSGYFRTMDGYVNAILGYSLPICLTEWNIAGGVTYKAYTQDPTYATPWIYSAIDDMVQAGFAMACQFEAGTGEGINGVLDMISVVSPFPPQADYQPIVNKNIQYLQHGSSALLLSVSRRSGTGLGAISRRDGTGLSAISRRDGTGLSAISRRDGTGLGTTLRRDGTGTTTKRRG